MSGKSVVPLATWWLSQREAKQLVTQLDRVQMSAGLTVWQLVCQPVSRPSRQPACQRVNHSTNQAVGHLVRRPTNQLASHLQSFKPAIQPRRLRGEYWKKSGETERIKSIRYNRKVQSLSLRICVDVFMSRTPETCKERKHTNIVFIFIRQKTIHRHKTIEDDETVGKTS